MSPGLAPRSDSSVSIFVFAGLLVMAGFLSSRLGTLHSLRVLDEPQVVAGEGAYITDGSNFIASDCNPKNQNQGGGHASITSRISNSLSQRRCRPEVMRASLVQ
jgi:hypothetical protein